MVVTLEYDGVEEIVVVNEELIEYGIEEGLYYFATVVVAVVVSVVFEFVFVVFDDDFVAVGDDAVKQKVDESVYE
jgi:hypothetical protein